MVPYRSSDEIFDGGCTKNHPNNSKYLQRLPETRAPARAVMRWKALDTSTQTHDPKTYSVKPQTLTSRIQDPKPQTL